MDGPSFIQMDGVVSLEGFNPAFECAGGAERFAKPHPPLRRPYLFPLAGKDMEEKGAGDAK